MSKPQPLAHLRVLELAGLAPTPFTGMLLADYGAEVMRVDRPSQPWGLTDHLVRYKTSIVLDLKSVDSRNLFLSLIPHIDILIDPYRPGVLERLGLGPETLLALHPRLIFARLVGFPRDGPDALKAGHDINYLAESGLLSMIGRPDEKPTFPLNVLADFAGGGLACFAGILLALVFRNTTGKGQVVDASMVNGVKYLSSMPRAHLNVPNMGGPRGTNLLDGGCPYYDVYATKHAEQFVAVGCLEPQFYADFIKGLGSTLSELPDREDQTQWPHLRTLFATRLAERTRQEWLEVFRDTQACVSSVVAMRDVQGPQPPLVVLEKSPSKDVNQDMSGLPRGRGAERMLQAWAGWTNGKEYRILDSGVAVSTLAVSCRAKL